MRAYQIFYAGDDWCESNHAREFVAVYDHCSFGTLLQTVEVSPIIGPDDARFSTDQIPYQIPGVTLFEDFEAVHTSMRVRVMTLASIKRST
jgi:hypothetical protein